MVIIKNMDIPKGCQKCRFFRKHMFGNGLDYSYSCELGAKDFPMPWIRQEEERATDCPLEDLEDVYNLAKSTNNVGNEIRYSEYLRILKESDMFSKMETLYCFKYDKENGKLTKIEIPEYGISVNKFTERKTYYFNKPRINKSSGLYQVQEEKIDRFVSDKVFTFNPDVENVKRIILNTICCKRNKAYDEYIKYSEMVDDIHRRGIKDA